MACSPDCDTRLFDIVTGVLQDDTLASYQFIIRSDNVLWMSIDQIKENSFIFFKKKGMKQTESYKN